MAEQCPVCGAHDALVHDTRDLLYTLSDGRSGVVPAVTGQHCTHCGDCLLGGGESRRVSAHMLGKEQP